MTKSIRILLAIATWYDYEIWQMDVKITFLNGFVEEKIYMDQPKGFTSVGEEQKDYNFIKNECDPCVYKKISGSTVAYLLLYVDDILLIGYSEASFHLDDDDAKSQSGFVFKLNGGVVCWKSSKKATTADSTT
ncbi:Secreted RxLR effector protein [Sesamum angolense]|uniref:Secreted RxLR effector protein n=1 Tax=Sesamum angolense TaxID=2727404 RepID=A0AAE2C560_9LAMI|nr:Secreted RxLR effector protein [Sesamum angolense]